MKQSFAWWSFGRDAGPETLLKAAAALGFDGVELIEEDYFPLVQQHGLTLATHRAHSSLEQGLNQQANHTGIFKEVEANLKLATRWNIPVLICFSGNRNGISDEEGIEVTAAGLRHIAPLADAAGVTVVLELLNSKIDHPDYHCDRTRFGVEIIERVASPNVKLLYDIYHMQIMEGDIVRTIREHHAHFGHYHTAGNPGRQDLDDEQELNYSSIFRAIRDTGYQGYVGHEFIPKGETETALRAAFTLCDQSR